MINEEIQKEPPFFSLDGLLQGLGNAFLKSIRDPFAIIAKGYHILWINKPMAVIHGGSHGGNHEDAVGKICYEIFHGGFKPCKNCPLGDIFKTGRSQISERCQNSSDGIRWGEVKVYPIKGPDDSIIAAYVVIFEITDLKRTIESQKKYSRHLSKQLESSSGKSQTVFLDDGAIAMEARLTLREREVLRLITEGYTNMQISEILLISPHTVKTHVINIFNKLGVSDRTEAAVMAIRYKLL